MKQSIQHHAEHRIKLAMQQAAAADPITGEPIQIDPFRGDPPSKKKDSEVSRVLTILNSLNSLEERGNIR